jgi:lytic murein transglycosylase
LRLAHGLSFTALALTVSCGAEARRRHHRAPLAEPTGVASAPSERPLSEVPVAACSEIGEEMDAWLASFGRFAVSEGVSEDTAKRALELAWWDPEVVDLDRAQRTNAVSYEVFLASHVTRERVARGRQKRKALADVLTKMEAQYGVQGEILVAIWGLETDFGDHIGDRSSIRSLATLAYDCRRSARFRAELLSALRILDRGDVPAEELHGGWAGEIGQTQFMPSSYEKFAVDFDGDGRRDLLGSSLDALASTANFLKSHGWTPMAGYGSGAPNFAILAEWNASDRWDKTIAAFAAKL